jgi:hypothetical protein
LLAAEDRLIKQEILTARGRRVVIILWDIAKFFDSLRYPWLFEQLIRLHYPAQRTAISGLVHATPKALKVGQAIGERIAGCGRSIVARCLRSLSFARAHTACS